MHPKDTRCKKHTFRLALLLVTNQNYGMRVGTELISHLARAYWYLDYSFPNPDNRGKNSTAMCSYRTVLEWTAINTFTLLSVFQFQ